MARISGLIPLRMFHTWSRAIAVRPRKPDEVTGGLYPRTNPSRIRSRGGSRNSRPLPAIARSAASGDSAFDTVDKVSGGDAEPILIMRARQASWTACTAGNQRSLAKTRGTSVVIFQLRYT